MQNANWRPLLQSAEDRKREQQQARRNELQKLRAVVQRVNDEPQPTVSQLAVGRQAATRIRTLLSTSASANRTLAALVAKVVRGQKLYAAARERGFTTIPVYPRIEAVRACLIRGNRVFRKGPRAGRRFTVYDPDGSGRLHQCFVYEKDGEKAPVISKSRHILVSCDCEFYKYTCEAGLNHHGYAEMLHANDTDAPDTNPRRLPVLCKHLLRVSELIKREGL